MIQTEVKHRFSRILTEHRKSIGYLQKEVAAKIEEKPSTYAAWEEGRAQPHYHQLDKLYRIFGESFIEKLFQ